MFYDYKIYVFKFLLFGILHILKDNDIWSDLWHMLKLGSILAFANDEIPSLAYMM